MTIGRITSFSSFNSAYIYKVDKSNSTFASSLSYPVFIEFNLLNLLKKINQLFNTNLIIFIFFY